MGQEQDVNDLMKARDELTQERDKLLNDITQCRRDLDDSSFKQNDLERKNQECNEQLLMLNEKIAQAKTENMKEAKKRVRTSEEIQFDEKFLFLFFSSRNKSNSN